MALLLHLLPPSGATIPVREDTNQGRGKGKSGGARVITLVVQTATTVYLLSIYDKGEQDDITDAELEALVKAATQ